MFLQNFVVPTHIDTTLNLQFTVMVILYGNSYILQIIKAIKSTSQNELSATRDYLSLTLYMTRERV